VTELRRFILEPTMDPAVTRLGTIVNRLVNMANGNASGRMWLLADTGQKKAVTGSSGIAAGSVLSANNYPLRVEPTSTNQVNVLHSNGSTVGLRVQDAGLTSGVPAALTSTLTVTGALTANGGTTTTTLTVSGVALLNGAVTLGDAAADVITVTGTATVAEILTLVKGLVVDTNTLVVDAVNNKVGIGAVPTSTSSMLDVAGQFRVTASTGFPTAGAGVEIGYAAGVGTIGAYDRTGSAWKELNINGIKLRLGNAAGTLIEMDATGIGFFAGSPVAQPAAGSAASDPASTQTLANALRTGLRNLGLFS
jgi:hypothetical protein